MITSALHILRNYWKSILAGICIAYLSLAPPSGFKGFSLSAFAAADKLIHFSMYFILSMLLTFDSQRLESTRKRHIQMLCLLFPILFGALMEVFQDCFIPGRKGDFLDLLANTVGVLTGYLFAAWILKKKQ